jgi:transposase InsO family protein
VLYFVLFIDDYSGMRFIYFPRKKSEAAGKFMELIHTIQGQTGNLVRTLRTDNGGEYRSNEFETWLGRKGIQHETSTSHTPQQDGVSERGIRTVTEGARNCLHDCQPPSKPWLEVVSIGTGNLIRESRLPISLWGEAAKCTVSTVF